MSQGAAEAFRAFHAYLHDASSHHVGAVAPLVKFEFTALAICACVVALFAVRVLLGRKGSAMRLPPGPKGLPIVGNLFDMPRKTYWKTFTDCFNCLPIAAIIDEKIFTMHGGLSPDLQSMEQIRRVMRPTDVPDTGAWLNFVEFIWDPPLSPLESQCLLYLERRSIV